jgi:hypothetical protein
MWPWSSWIVESIGAAGCVAIGLILTAPWERMMYRFWVLPGWESLVPASVVSYLYERFWDRNGLSYEDLFQRATVMLIIVAMIQVVR